MKRMYRAQILLEPEQHRELSRIARREGRSISETARRVIRAGLATMNADPGLRTRRVAALERLHASRQEIERQAGIVRRDLVAEVRTERAEEVLPENA
jgi:hypothetical protein